LTAVDALQEPPFREVGMVDIPPFKEAGVGKPAVAEDRILSVALQVVPE
jgi:hypothetical protein